jgi:hypothetical protein
VKIYLCLPNIKRYKEDWFSGSRKVVQLEINTGFILKKKTPDSDTQNWFEITILGFGLGFAWGECESYD